MTGLGRTDTLYRMGSARSAGGAELETDIERGELHKREMPKRYVRTARVDCVMTMTLRHSAAELQYLGRFSLSPLIRQPKGVYRVTLPIAHLGSVKSFLESIYVSTDPTRLMRPLSLLLGLCATFVAATRCKPS